MSREHISVAHLYNVADVRVLCGYVPTQLQKGMVVHTAVSKRTNVKVCVSMRFRDMTVKSPFQPYRRFYWA